jgi:hypothetical protein
MGQLVGCHAIAGVDLLKGLSLKTSTFVNIFFIDNTILCVSIIRPTTSKKSLVILESGTFSNRLCKSYGLSPKIICVIVYLLQYLLKWIQKDCISHLVMNDIRVKL